MRNRIRQGAFDRWYIFHEFNDEAAWSGSRWVPCTPDGIPVGGMQVCSFETVDEAIAFSRRDFDGGWVKFRDVTLLPGGVVRAELSLPPLVKPVVQISGECGCGGIMIPHPWRKLVWICNRSHFWNRRRHAYLVGEL
jgi:hypothetical protein